MPIVKHVNKARRRKQNREADNRRGSARERGYTAEWDRFAVSWLKRNPLCVYCEAQGRDTPAECVDHVEPHKGEPSAFWPSEGDHWHEFFAASCHHCHNGIKQAAERAAERRGVPVLTVLKEWGLWKTARQ